MADLFGIDVSIMQGTIDWRKAKAGGVDFAMIKASQGWTLAHDAYLFPDRQFTTNIANATAAGIPVGAYHYLTAATVAEAEREADYFLSVIAPHRDEITLWAAVDVEEGKYLPTANKPLLTSIVAAFCARVKAAGYKPMIYTNRDYMRYKFNIDALGGIDIWQAHWSANKPGDVSDRLQIWQYGLGAVSGVAGKVDCNRGYFSLPSTVENNATAARDYESGDHVRILPGAKYTNGISVPPRFIGTTQIVTSANTAGVYFVALVSRIKREGLERV